MYSTHDLWFLLSACVVRTLPWINCPGLCSVHLWGLLSVCRIRRDIPVRGELTGERGLASSAPPSFRHFFPSSLSLSVCLSSSLGSSNYLASHCLWPRIATCGQRRTQTCRERDGLTLQKSHRAWRPSLPHFVSSLPVRYDPQDLTR